MYVHSCFSLRARPGKKLTGLANSERGSSDAGRCSSLTDPVCESILIPVLNVQGPNQIDAVSNSTTHNGNKSLLLLASTKNLVDVDVDAGRGVDFFFSRTLV